MNPSENRESYAGWFELPSGESYHGRLAISGPDTRLTLWGADRFRLAPGSLDVVTGVIDNGKDVSLFDCLLLRETGFPLLQSQLSWRVDLFPHHVLAGHAKIEQDDVSVSAVSFSVPDADRLFSTRKRMAAMLSSRELLEETLRVHSSDIELDIGDSPEIIIHAGWKEIFSSATSLGRVSASHGRETRMNFTTGPRLKNRTTVRIDFAKKVDAKTAVSRAAKVSRFFELVVGRPQRPIRVSLEVEGAAGDKPATLDVYHTTTYGLPSQARDGDSVGLLIDPIAEADVFSDVLRRWVDREGTWEKARVQFSKAWQRGYDENRAVRAANIFDLIPATSFPEAVSVPEDVLEARDTARKLFVDTSSGPERSSVLGALGRVGRWTLKQRVRHRARIVVDQIGDRVPSIEKVTDAAVECRNEYVHGTRARVDCAAHVVFLTNTLEFVFSASDMVESGWDVASWWEAGDHQDHPFWQYLWTYRDNLKRLSCMGWNGR